MHTRLIICYVLLIVANFTTATLAEPATHPMHGAQPRTDRSYDSMRLMPEWTQGDMYFMGSADKQRWADLDPMEQYIIAGADDPTKDGENFVMPWSTVVFSAVCSFYTRFGYIPDQLGPEELVKVLGRVGAHGFYYEIYRNPLTGEWPKLKVEDPAPGDVYIRPLSPDEMRHYADLDSQYDFMWYPHQRTPETVKLEQLYGALQLSTPVFYMRIDGWDGPLLTGMQFQMRPTNPKEFAARFKTQAKP
jgi:hypothetical protein